MQSLASFFLFRLTDYSGFALMILLALGIINVTLLLLSLTRKIHRLVGAKQRFATLYSYYSTTITNSMVGIVDNAILARSDALDFFFRFNQVRIAVFV